MKNHSLQLALLAALCLVLSACQDRREPVKPTVSQAAAAQPLA